MKKKTNMMKPFYGGGSTVSRLPIHNDETNYFLQLSFQDFLVLIRLTLEGWKTGVNLGATQWFWTQELWIGNPAL